MNVEKKDGAIYYRAWDNVKETRPDGKKVNRLPEKITQDLEKNNTACTDTAQYKSVAGQKKP